ncbi:MAG TPA: hypothetical protein VES19_02010 [Candidatus Limnocylindrales bacterium]|nr:hypothetical protein [Candidatus Limnocylindrales bacterium]
MGVKGFLKTVVARLAWVVIALLIALGSAGIVATMGQVPGTSAREELTWAADMEVAPQLDAATDDLEALAAGVDRLAESARRALTQLSDVDPGALTGTIDEGTAQLLEVTSLERELAEALANVPYTGDDWALHVSPGIHERWRQLDGAAGLAAGLEADWAGFTGRAIDAARLSTLLVRHDEETAAAAKAGSAGTYKAAVVQLDASDATIAAAIELRDRLSRSTDVTTLTEWLDRNAAYDKALRTLYAALIKSDGRATSEVKKAFEGEQAARAQLPGDTRGMVVIMSDIAQGGLNQVVIAIEETRGALAQALEAGEPLKSGGELVPPE